LRSLSLAEIEPLLDGHIDLKRRAGALQPMRLPVAEQSFYDPFNRWVASTAAGVRLRLRTDSLRLRVAATQRLLLPNTTPETRGAWDLYVDGDLHARSFGEGGALMTADGGLTGDDAFSIGFDDLPAGDKLVELWLPQAATVGLTGLEIDDAATISPAPDARPRILFHGSSITHCMEAEGASNGWTAVAARLAGVSHTNLGWAGSCLLSGLAARIIRDQPADAIVLKLGINVHPGGQLAARTFLDSAHAMVSIIREKHPTTPLVIASPIFSPPREDAAEAGGVSLRGMRMILADMVATRQAAGDPAIRYLDGLSLFGAADAHLLPDDLHPNTVGYRRMGERFCALMLTGPDALVAA